MEISKNSSYIRLNHPEGETTSEMSVVCSTCGCPAVVSSVKECYGGASHILRVEPCQICFPPSDTPAEGSPELEDVSEIFTRVEAVSNPG